MIYKIYDFQYEVNKFLYGLGKGNQQYRRTVPHIEILASPLKVNDILGLGP